MNRVAVVQVLDGRLTVRSSFVSRVQGDSSRLLLSLLVVRTGTITDPCRHREMIPSG